MVLKTLGLTISSMRRLIGLHMFNKVLRIGTETINRDEKKRRNRDDKMNRFSSEENRQI